MAVMSSLRDKTHIILYTLLAAFLALYYAPYSVGAG